MEPDGDYRHSTRTENVLAYLLDLDLTSLFCPPRAREGPLDRGREERNCFPVNPQPLALRRSAAQIPTSQCVRHGGEFFCRFVDARAADQTQKRYLLDLSTPRVLIRSRDRKDYDTVLVQSKVFVGRKCFRFNGDVAQLDRAVAS